MPRVNAGGTELWYEQAGEGIPLIVQGHAHLPWLQFQVPFFAQRYHVITFDRRGTGRSAAPDGDWTVTDFAADVVHLMDALGIERSIIGGASLGGMIACQQWDLRPRYAELRAMRIPTLVIVGGHEPQKTIELSYEWQQQMPTSEYVILPDAYHGAAREQPVDWNMAVLNFLQRHGF